MSDNQKVIVENSNDNILNNIDIYLSYIRETIKQIIIDDDLKYSEPMDKKKVYPDFTYTQFLYLLSRVYDRVYSINTELLYNAYNNKYNKSYNVDKVKLCYEVYYRLCGYYGFICSAEGFYIFSGIDVNTLQEWLSSGRSNLLNIMRKNAKNSTIARFENSPAPLLNLAAANYKYNINQHETMHEGAPVLEVLPDLLALPGAEKPPMIEEK
ncbi:MAG: hypothetical protein IKN95_09925 [Lachnospiraceae bacterium]|nr:hypothetical protein [Lachnospiraceae bacterium]